VASHCWFGAALPPAVNGWLQGVKSVSGRNGCRKGARRPEPVTNFPTISELGTTHETGYLPPPPESRLASRKVVGTRQPASPELFCLKRARLARASPPHFPPLLHAHTRRAHPQTKPPSSLGRSGGQASKSARGHHPRSPGWMPETTVRQMWAPVIDA